MRLHGLRQLVDEKSVADCQQAVTSLLMTRCNKPDLNGFVDKFVATYTCLALWKHHVNLLLESFRSVSSDLHQC